MRDQPRAQAIETITVVVAGGGALAGATTTAYFTPICAGLVAIAVALIAARTARSRLTMQLAAEHHRHVETLAADHARQAAQLAHDRELADLRDLRDLLDEASVALQQVGLPVARRPRSPAKEVDLDSYDRGRLHAAASSLDGIAARLRIRLGATDPLMIAFAQAHSAVRELARALPGRQTPPIEHVQDAIQTFRMGVEEFYDAALGHTRPALRASCADRGLPWRSVHATSMAIEASSLPFARRRSRH